MANYRLKKTLRPPAKYRNEDGVIVVTSATPVKETVPATVYAPEYERELPAASQRDLKFGYEVMGLVDWIEKEETTTGEATGQKEAKKA